MSRRCKQIEDPCPSYQLIPTSSALLSCYEVNGLNTIHLDFCHCKMAQR